MFFKQVIKRQVLEIISPLRFVYVHCECRCPLESADITPCADPRPISLQHPQKSARMSLELELVCTFIPIATHNLIEETHLSFLFMCGPPTKDLVAHLYNFLWIILPTELDARIVLVGRVRLHAPTPNQIFTLQRQHAWCIIWIFLPTWRHLRLQSKLLVKALVKGSLAYCTEPTYQGMENEAHWMIQPLI